VKIARKIICIAAFAGMLASCSLNDTPSGSNSVPNDSTVVDSVEDTIAPEVAESTPETVPTTVPETTTTMPEVDLKCVTVLKCQFSYFVGADYSLLKLEFTDFSVANLQGAKFVRTNLKQTTFIRADLSNADFTGANLGSANLTGAIVAGANFTNANFTNTVICGLDLTTAIGVTQAQLEGAQMFRAKGNKYCP
jgi:Pentapeptide repeats (8 copies)